MYNIMLTICLALLHSKPMPLPWVALCLYNGVTSVWCQLPYWLACLTSVHVAPPSFLSKFALS